MISSPRIRVVLCALWLAGSLAAQTGPVEAQAAAPNTQSAVLEHLNLVLRWSRQWASPDVSIARAGDEFYLGNGRNIAEQVVKLEFQSALAQAALISSMSRKQSGYISSSNGVDPRNILRAQQQITMQLNQLQSDMESVSRKLATARPRERDALINSRDTLQGKIQLAQALRDNLQQLTTFMASAENANGVATELSAKITALERTAPGAGALPAATGSVAPAAKAAAASPAKVSASPGQGMIGEVGEMIRLGQTLRALDQLSSDAVRLQTATAKLRAPLLAALRSTLQEGQIELAGAAQSSSSAANTAGPTAQSGAAPEASVATPAILSSGATAVSKKAQTAAAEQHAMTALVQRFKLLSKATLPLSQEMILVDQSQANLAQLQTSIKRDYFVILRSLLIKVASILIALGLIWLFSEVWRRATFRYIKDGRRRRQFLVLRRVITGFCMFIVILLGFISDFSSLATYAGLITAGVAVALQAVILSIAAYFFLVGRYGVKVGDRITVVYNGPNSVAGDVVDIGLVRFYMMELAGSGIDLQPTGRIVVFPNSVLFQTNPLFKQLPGTEYTWREIALPLDRETDAQLAEHELSAVTNKLYDSYSEQLERQHVNVESMMGVRMMVPRPYTRMRFAGAALELMARYPIPLRQAAELDDKIVAEVTEMLRKNPAIRLAAGSAPELRAPVKV